MMDQVQVEEEEEYGFEDVNAYADCDEGWEDARMEEFVSVRVDSPRNLSLNLNQSNYNDDYLPRRPAAAQAPSSLQL